MSDTLREFELAIVYWFYKEPEVTKNHLELIRKHNPNRKIYGLFGGDPSEASKYQQILGGLLDDFWTYPGTYGDDSFSKWIHGDLLLLDWYDKRGRDLTWDSVAIVQWDMLLFADIQDLVPGIHKGQVFFSGYRELDEAVENRWKWTRPDDKYRQQFLDFCKYVSEKYSHREQLKCCLFIFEILTREFFDKYLELPEKQIGMLEYKDPTLAHIFGIDIYEHDLGVYWRDQRQSTEASPLNAMGVGIQKSYIEAELGNPPGWRLFHPYEENWLG